MLQLSLLIILIFWSAIIAYMAFHKRSWIELIVIPILLSLFTYGVYFLWEDIPLLIITIHSLLFLWIIYKVVAGILLKKLQK